MRNSKRVLASVALLAGTILTIGPAQAAPAAPAVAAAPAQTDTQYTASGDAKLLGVDALLAGQALLDADLTPSIIDVDSTGTPRSAATVQNLDGSALVGNLPLGDILSTATQTAPPDNAQPLEAVLLDVPAEPVLALDVSRATAHARWPGDGVCLAPGEDIAHAYVETAGASVLTDPAIGTVATVNDSDGGATYTESFATLVDVADQAGHGVQNTSQTQIDGVTLLAGTPAELTIGISDNASLVATATGKAGGATAVYNAPVVNITTPDSSSIPDIPLINLTPPDQLADLLDTITQGIEDGLDATLASAGVIDVNIFLGEENLVVDAAADGTSVSASTAVVRIEIVVLAAAGDPILDAVIEIGKLNSSASVPAGGVLCGSENPLRDTHKDVSQAQVLPGGTFDYTLTIPNRGPCTLTDVVVTDAIKAPAGTTIAPDLPETSKATAGEVTTYTWNIGELAPEETKTITLTITVPSNAPNGYVFEDDLAATGKCDGRDVGQTRELNLPKVVTEGFSGECNLSLSNKRASHLEVVNGQTFNYFVHVFNRGTGACDSVDVTDVLDDRLSFVSCSDSCTNSGQTVTWTGQKVAGGSGFTLTVTVLVKDDATGTLENAADIKSNGKTVRATWTGPNITDTSIIAPPNPPSLLPDQLTVTGRDIPMAAVLGMALVGLMGLGWRRRFSA